MKEYGLKALRDQVTVVLQKNILFSGTIRDNLRWGNKNAAGREICDAAELANAGQFIEMLPEGYDTMLTGDHESLIKEMRDGGRAGRWQGLLCQTAFHVLTFHGEYRYNFLYWILLNGNPEKGGNL